MKSFIARRVRNVAVLKIGIPIAITLGSFFLIAMIVSAIIAAIISPIETVKMWWPTSSPARSQLKTATSISEPASPSTRPH
ncbi:hypothetical protein GS528_16715 [Rhodococcus hoagii]|nr:hypothetical protein [Prescottella equi]